MTLISVDLPAPFSPTSAWTSPRATANDTSSSATTPGQRLLTERASSTGAPSGALACSRESLIGGGVRSGERRRLSIRRGHRRLRVGLVVLLVGDDHVVRDALAGHEVRRGLERERPEARVGLDHRVD